MYYKDKNDLGINFVGGSITELIVTLQSQFTYMIKKIN